MRFPDITLRMTLRAKLLALNAVVVLSLAELSWQAWRATVALEQAQAGQVRLSEALRQGQQADMLHDALRASVFAAVLGAPSGLRPDDLVDQANDDAQGLLAALDVVARTEVTPAFTDQVAASRQAAQAYAAAAVEVVRQAAADRARAATALPAFNTRFRDLQVRLAQQNDTLSRGLQAAQATAAEDAGTARRNLLTTCLLTIMAASAMVAGITAAIRRRLRALGAVAQSIADGQLDRRINAPQTDEIGDLGRTVDKMAANLQHLIDTMRGDSRRAHFGRQLGEALDMADREPQVGTVAARAMAEISPSHAMELLLSDSSQAQLERAAEHPGAGASGCGVGSPYECVAVRRGNVVSFDDSESLNACTHLRGRPCGPVSAVCVPVTFMGRAIGVLHAAGSVDAPLRPEQAQQLGTLGVQLGGRIGTVRAFEKTQLQAATDSLTGLPNRRSLEQRLRSVAGSGETHAVVMCDLDRFKLLNDTHGHAAGDGALRTFADVLRHSLRESDVVGRWGGEEFAFVLRGADARAAADMADRIRRRLASTLKVGKGPTFTASFGVADSTMATRPEQLIRLADIALYQAKASGRDRACIADGSLDLDAVPVRTPDAGPGIDNAALQCDEVD